ncbi:hypothetical protein EJ110_NYTH21064, partial [Nymphaea thermarum]
KIYPETAAVNSRTQGCLLGCASSSTLPAFLLPAPQAQQRRPLLLLRCRRISLGRWETSSPSLELAASNLRLVQVAWRVVQMEMSFFISGIRDTFVSLSAAKAIVKKKRHRGRRRNQKAYDLSALAEFLPEISSSQAPTPTTSKLKCKSKQKLV